MSCGEPHATPCSEVLEVVYLYLDGEQDDAHRDQIRIHLDECAPCLRQYGTRAHGSFRLLCVHSRSRQR